MSITNERLHELVMIAEASDGPGDWFDPEGFPDGLDPVDVTYLCAMDPTIVRALIAEVLTLREQRDKVLELAEPASDYWDGAQGYELHEVAGMNELARYIREALSATEEADDE